MPMQRSKEEWARLLKEKPELARRIAARKAEYQDGEPAWRREVEIAIEQELAKIQATQAEEQQDEE